MDADHRAVVLLNILGQDAREAVLSSLESESSERVRTRLERLDRAPPSNEDIDDVLEEFERCLRLASQFAAGEPETQVPQRLSVTPADSDESESQPPAVLEEPECEFASSGDPITDLNSLDPQRIVAAVQTEPPRLISIILSCLDPRKAATALCELEAEERSAVCVDLNKGVTAPRNLIEYLVKRTVEKALTLDSRELASDELDGDHRLAQVLRSMDKQARAEVLSMIEKQDAEMVGRVRDLLYEFEDLLSIDDRSMQRLLGEVETSVLATALFGADEEVKQKVFKNLSKRAQQTLRDELEFMGNVSPEAAEEAENEIVKVISQLDQSGELTMTS